MEKRYRVESTNSQSFCSTCGRGQYWDIVDPDGVASSTSYSDKEEAEEICAMLNEALDRGAKSGEFDCR